MLGIYAENTGVACSTNVDIAIDVGQKMYGKVLMVSIVTFMPLNQEICEGDFLCNLTTDHNA